MQPARTRSLALQTYRAVTAAVSPLIPFWLYLRSRKGKEDPARLRERFGYASLPRPEGKLLLVHAASVGEANSVLPLTAKIRAAYPQWNVLLTTGTVSSARLMQRHLPEGI